MSNNGKTRYININGHGGVYWTTEEGNIFVRTSEPSQPTASEIAEAIERRAEERKKLERLESHVDATSSIHMESYLEAIRTGDKERENNAIQGLMYMQRARRTLRGT